MANLMSIACMGIAFIAYAAAQDKVFPAMMTSAFIIWVLGKLEEK